MRRRRALVKTHVVQKIGLNQEEKINGELKRYGQTGVCADFEPIEHRESDLLANIADRFNFLFDCQVD